MIQLQQTGQEKVTWITLAYYKNDALKPTFQQDSGLPEPGVATAT